MDKRKKVINKITKVGIFAALSVILYYIKFPLPFFPSFLEINFSMLPIILVGFMFGPIEASVIIIIRFLLKIPSTHTAMVGEIGDAIIGLLVIIPTSLIYQSNKSKKGGVIALIITFIIWSIVGTLSNLVTIPLYIKLLFNGSTDQILNAISIIPGVNEKNYMIKYLLFGALPFNLLLSFVICLITYFLYKQVSTIFKKDFFKEKSTNNYLGKVMIMIDSFKGTISSKEANNITSSILEKKGYYTRSVPISDGGEGFLDTMVVLTKLTPLTAKTYDALLREHMARYLYDEKTKTAYVELAECCGIKDLKTDELDVFNASSYGLGFLMNYIITTHDVKKMVVGIGGSASTDGGAGLLEALGAEFFDENGEKLVYMNNQKLAKIAKLRLGSVKSKFENIDVELLTDVKNPLLGAQGAVYVFSKQKGAKDEDLETLEANMAFYKKQLETLGFLKPVSKTEGEGAAGGVGYAFNRVLHANISSGVDTILEKLNFEEICKEFDVIITGEGCFDEQTLNGKVVKGIMEYHPKKLIVVTGSKKIDTDECVVYSIVPNICSLEESMAHPKEYFAKLIETIEL